MAASPRVTPFADTEHSLFSLIFLFEIQTISSYPFESFVYETNPIQKLSFRYNQDASTKPIKFKLQTVSFKVNEHTDLDFDKTSKLESDNKIESKEIKENKSKTYSELKEEEQKYKQLSRFTVFYNIAKNAIPKHTKINTTTNYHQIIKIIHKNTTVPTSVYTAELKAIDSGNSKSENNSSNGTTYLNTIPSTTENNQFDIDKNTENFIDSTTNTVDIQTINQENYIDEHYTTNDVDIIRSTENTHFDIDVTTENIVDSTTEMAEGITINFIHENSNSEHYTTDDMNLISVRITENDSMGIEITTEDVNDSSMKIIRTETTVNVNTFPYNGNTTV